MTQDKIKIEVEKDIEELKSLTDCINLHNLDDQVDVALDNIPDHFAQDHEDAEQRKRMWCFLVGFYRATLVG